MPLANLFSFFFFQNTLSLLRHHSVMAQQEKLLKEEVAEWERVYQNATSISKAASKQQANQISKLESSVAKLRNAKKDAKEEAKKEKANAEEAV